MPNTQFGIRIERDREASQATVVELLRNVADIVENADTERELEMTLSILEMPEK